MDSFETLSIGLFTTNELKAMDEAIRAYHIKYGIKPTVLYVYDTDPAGGLLCSYDGCKVYEYGPQAMEDPHCVYAHVPGVSGHAQVRIPAERAKATDKTKPPEKPRCFYHVRATYTGLHEVFDYCTVCGERV